MYFGWGGVGGAVEGGCLGGQITNAVIAREKISKFKRGSSFHIKIEIFGILDNFNMLNQMRNSAKLKNEPFLAQGLKKLFILLN